MNTTADTNPSTNPSTDAVEFVVDEKATVDGLSGKFRDIPRTNATTLHFLFDSRLPPGKGLSDLHTAFYHATDNCPTGSFGFIKTFLGLDQDSNNSARDKKRDAINIGGIASYVTSSEFEASVDDASMERLKLVMSNLWDRLDGDSHELEKITLKFTPSMATPKQGQRLCKIASRDVTVIIPLPSPFSNPLMIAEPMYDQKWTIVLKGDKEEREKVQADLTSRTLEEGPFSCKFTSSEATKDGETILTGMFVKDEFDKV